MSIYKDLKMEYRFGGTPERVIYWNVGLFLASIALFYQFRSFVFVFPDWLQLVGYIDTLWLRPWTLVTYAFLHASFLHLLFNMLTLFFAARIFTTFFNGRQFLGLYLLSAIFSGLVFVLTFYLTGSAGNMVGASGAIMAVLLAATTYQPLMSIRLMLIGYVKLWHIAAVLLLLDLMQLHDPNFGGHIAHLSGALFGFLYIRLLQRGVDLSRVMTLFEAGGWQWLKPAKKRPFRQVHTNPKAPGPKVKPAKDRHQQQIDDILDKISKSGYDSLTKEEKEFLFKAGNP